MAKNKIEGLGDVVAKFTEVFGIDKANTFLMPLVKIADVMRAGRLGIRNIQ